MKVKEGFTLRSLGNDHIIVAEGIKNVNFNKMIAMNESATYLWESIQGKDFAVKDLSDLLLERYDIDPQTAEKDSSAIAQAWIDAGIVEK